MTLLVTEYMVFGEVSQVTCTKFGLQEGCCCVFRVVVVVLVSLATRRVFCLRWGLRQRIERVSTRVLISLGATTAVEDVDGSIAKVEEEEVSPSTARLIQISLDSPRTCNFILK